MKLKPLIITLAAICFTAVISFLSWIQYHEYHPQEKLWVVDPVSSKIDDSLGILLWNISYGGMPAEMDFFYSGGIRIQLEEEKSKANFLQILNVIESYKDSTDVFLFHKVDSASKRAYGVNQIGEIQRRLNGYESVYCPNFAVPYIPVPLDQPLGKVYSGMLSLSSKGAVSHRRIALSDKDFYWPKKLFTAKKCMDVAKYPKGNSHLYIINVHLNSYDYMGEIRLSQLKEVENLAQKLYQEGNYVIIGGGWNMNPPHFKQYKISYDYKGKVAFPEVDSEKYFKGWKFDYQNSIPTSRVLHEAYRHSALNTTIKDFFICSPNVTVLRANTVSQKFEFSDHHPIYLRVFLK